MSSSKGSSSNYLSTMRSSLVKVKSSGFYSFQDLLKYLNSKNSAFPSSLLDQIYSNGSLDSSKGISLDRFLESFSSFESKCKTKIDECKESVRSLSTVLTSTRRELIEARANKSQEDNNLLTVLVKEGKMLKHLYPIIVRVICDEWEVCTNAAFGEWNEVFTFNTIEARQLTIELWTSVNKSLEKIIGKIDISIDALKNEEVYEKWFRVIPSNELIEQVYVRSHWVRNKVEYIERCILDIEQKLEKARKDLIGAEELHEQLLSPFLEKKEDGFDSEISRGIDEFFKDRLGKKVKWGLAFSIGLYCFMVLSMIMMLVKVDFLNITVFCLLYAQNAVNRQLRIGLRSLILFVMASQCLDFFEIICYEYLYGESRFNIVWRAIIFVNVNIKLLLSIIFWKTYFK